MPSKFERYNPEEGKEVIKRETDRMIDDVKTTLDEKGNFKDIDERFNVSPDIKDEMKIIETRKIIKEQSASNFARHQVENEEQRKMYDDLLKEKEEIVNNLEQVKFWEIKKKSDLRVKLRGVDARIKIIGDNLKATEPLIKRMESRMEALVGQDEEE